jgi:FkbM family methyltransferase
MSRRYGKTLAGVVTALTAPMKPWRRAATLLWVADELRQRHKVQTRHGPLAFVIGDARGIHLVRDFLTREPETIEWIDSFPPGSLFWDIGANIGIYSLYAAIRPGIAVCAFEPAPATYGALCRNIEANAAADIEAYCIALGDRTKLDRLNMSATYAGSVFNAFGTQGDRADWPAAVAFRQASIGYTVDEFRRQFGLPAPNYVKIDVDSTEEEIVSGAAETLRDPALRSVLVEFDYPETERSGRITDLLGAAGLVLDRRGVPAGTGINAIFVKPG